MPSNLSSRVADHAITRAQVLRFATTSKHRQRRKIALTYLLLRLRLGISKKMGRPTSCFSLLGTRIRFSDPGTLEYVFREVFIEECYAGCPIAPSTILDCGSNIGMSILYFKSCWPDAKITGVEASPYTFALLKENTAGLKDVLLINKAVGDKGGMISFYTVPGLGVSSTNPMRGGGIETTVETAPLSYFIDGPLDLLKIDIEGSETAAFEELEASGKMPLIGFMFIEYHHHLPDENHGLSSFLSRLERCGFDYETASFMPKSAGGFQDIIIRAWRGNNSIPIRLEQKAWKTA
jgi:FkbM family methyltransferase